MPKGDHIFTHAKQLQYKVRVDRPDPIYTRQLQKLIGGKYGESSVMMQYLFHGWGLRGAQDDARLRRLKDMLLDTGTEEIAHVEMLATCFAIHSAIPGGPKRPEPAMKAPQEQESLVDKIGDKLSGG